MLDLVRQYQSIKDEIDSALLTVVGAGEYILGKNVKELEKEIADLCGVRYGVGVANGSDALHLALLACGIGPGDEVITTPFSFFATAGSIVRAGATPVFADIDPVTFNIDATAIEKAVSKRTKAIIPVHLYGQAADMDVIMQCARKYGLTVIEDTAQALGATYQGQKTCSFGDLGCISFFPSKNLGAFGDGGMVVTNDEVLYEKLRILRVHGSKPKYYHHMLGYNSRLDEIQAAILRVKLRYLEEWSQARNKIAKRYNEALAPLMSQGFIPPREADGVYHIYHQYTVRVKGHRDALREHLQQSGIATSIYYPLALHLQPVFRGLGYTEGSLPEAEAATREVLSLPIFPEMTGEELETVVSSVFSFYEKNQMG